MEFNPLPTDHAGPQKRETEFESPEAKLAYDAANLVRIAKEQSDRLGIQVDPIALARRKDDNIEALQAAIDKERETVRPAVDTVMAAEVEPSATATGATEPGAVASQAAPTPAAELSPEQIWLGEFRTRFDALPQLHTKIEWADVERSLKADPEAMRRLQALDEKGHQMNVFGEEEGEYIFVSAWGNYEQVASDHRNIAYDPEGQELAEQQGRQPNGNAVSIIAGIMGVEEDKAGNYLADQRFHEQLREVIAINGWAWLKTHAATRKNGFAILGYTSGISGDSAEFYRDYGSFRAELRVKKT